MVRSPCCDEAGVKKGPWTPEEDEKLTEYIKKHGHGSWRQLPLNAGLNRCGKSCRLRWTNYLRPDIKRGKFSEEEERLIIHLHSILGNKWSLISTKLQGRTDNEIKNHWNTHLKKKLLIMGIDPVTHHRRPELTLLANLPNLLSSSNSCHSAANSWDSNALKLQAEAAHQLAQAQILQSLFHALFASSPNTNSPSNLNANNLLFSPSLSPLRSIADIFEASRRIEAFMSHLSSFGHAHDPVLAESYEFGNHTKSQQLMSELNNAYENQHVMIDSKNMTKPTEVYTAPENCTSSVDLKQGGHLCSSEISPDNSESSTPLPVWDELHLGTDPDVSDLGWRDILEEIAW